MGPGGGGLVRTVIGGQGKRWKLLVFSSLITDT